MAIGFGDLVPYSQLPGAVAGAQSENIAGAYNRGVSQSANASKASSEADMSDMADQIAQAKLPSALVLSNLKDAQSINHLPPKASFDDLQDAHKEVMGNTDAKPDKLQTAKIMALADQKAQARMPKFDPNNPGEWFAKQDPTSNQEMTLVKAQALLDGKLGMQQQNLDLRKDKFAYQQTEDVVKEAGKDRRVGLMTGVGVNGAPVPRLAERKFSAQLDKEFSNSTVGRIAAVRNKDGSRSPMWDDTSMYPDLENKLKQIINTRDYDTAKSFYNKYKEDFQKHGVQEPAPPKQAPARPQSGTRFGASGDFSGGQIGPDEMLASQEVPPPSDAAGGRGPSLEGDASVAPGMGVRQADGSYDMPEQNESAQYRKALSRDVGDAVDKVTGSDVYKGVAQGIKGAAKTIMGSGAPVPLLNEPRRQAADGTEVQKYSDGKWYAAGSQPGGEDSRGPAGASAQVVHVGNRVYRVGDIIQLKSGVKYRVNPDGSGDRVK